MGKQNRWPERPVEYGLHMTYRILFAAFCIFLVYLFCTYHRSIDVKNEKRGFEVLQCIEEKKVPEEKSSLGYAMEYTYLLPHISGNYRTLVFYSSYHDVMVSINGKGVYTMMGPKGGYVMKTSAHCWNQVAFENEDANQFVTIKLIPDYEGIASEPEDVLFGETDKIHQYYVRQDMPSMILSVTAILIGVFFFGYCFVNWKNQEIDKNLVMLGLFSFLVGLWKLTDTRALTILFPNTPTLYILPFFCLSFAAFAFLGYSKYLFERKDDILWTVIEVILLISTAAVLILQLVGILEFRQTLVVTHVTIALALFVFVLEVIREYQTVGIGTNLRFNAIYILLCLVGVIWDISAYYFSAGQSHRMIGGILCFVIYVAAMGYFSINKAKVLMVEGARAKEYERLAYQDPLTGIPNRMAYNHFVENDNFQSDEMAVAMFDLNDLKKCNDSLGHEMGDIYISSVAEILDKTFRGVGTAFRIGGDEFTVLVPHASKEKMDILMQKVDEEIKKANEKCPVISMRLASGYAIYESEKDETIEDAFRRADALMYAKKYQIKHDKIIS